VAAAEPLAVEQDDVQLVVDIALRLPAGPVDRFPAKVGDLVPLRCARRAGRQQVPEMPL
jgi:hypothetical protein